MTFLRPGWYMENARWDTAPAADTGVIPSFLQPLGKPVPMVATADVGQVASELLLQTWRGQRILELEGLSRVKPNEISATLSAFPNRPAHMKIVTRESWSALFRSQGMRNPEPRIRMLDGFNEGWIEFSESHSGTRKGKISIETVLRELVQQSGVIPSRLR